MSDKPDKVVNITMVGGVPTPDQDPVEVKKDKQKIRWCATFDFQIEIDGYTDLHYGTGGGDCAYRCTTGTFKDAVQYKYTITANGVSNDPFVDVKP